MTAAAELCALQQRLADYAQELRARAEEAGPQAHALTYRYVADEIEQRFAQGAIIQGARRVAEPVFAFGE